ncbi:MAG: site-specific integrase [Haloferacaceae archaeon]|nr:site-specific integrase [Haloferacaceae archaeon]
MWLSSDELELLIDTAPNASAAIAFALGGRCGLRSQEVADVTPKDIQHTDAGPIIRVVGKGDKYREAWIPEELVTRIETAAEFREMPSHLPIVQSSGDSTKVATRTLRRWIADAAAELVTQTDDDAWAQVSFHDLRRSWATNLAAAGVDPILVFDVGGWNDLETFLDHYRGSYSPEAHRREREKVSWL